MQIYARDFADELPRSSFNSLGILIYFERFHSQAHLSTIFLLKADLPLAEKLIL
jgi:hypothetical protein